MGIRPSSKAYQYLLFALTQLQCGTPFQNSIWELTAIHFGQKRENVLACVRREIAQCFPYGTGSFLEWARRDRPSTAASEYGLPAARALYDKQSCILSLRSFCGPSFNLNVSWRNLWNSVHWWLAKANPSAYRGETELWRKEVFIRIWTRL